MTIQPQQLFEEGVKVMVDKTLPFEYLAFSFFTFKRKGDVVTGSTFPVWETVTVGAMTSADIAASLGALGIQAWQVEKVVGARWFRIAKRSAVLPLVRVSAVDLGLPLDRCVTAREFYDRANELGLRECPSEVGPLVRLADPEQVPGDYYEVSIARSLTRTGLHRRQYAIHRYDDGRIRIGAFLRKEEDLRLRESPRCVFLAPETRTR